MNFFKALISWKLWLAILLGLGLLVGLWFGSFDYLEKYTNHGVQVDVPDLSDMSIQEGLAKLDELDLKYEVDSVKFSEEYEPYAILDFYPQAGSKVKPGRRIFIKSNPRSWAPVEVPDLKDKSKRLAITLLNMKGFVVGDTIYIEDPARDAVLGMLYNNDTVHVGDKLERGSKIDLVLGRGFRMDMPVPNVEGMTLSEAKSFIHEKFFDLGQVYYLDGARDTLDTKVVYQDPPPQDTYDQGLPISLWLSKKNTSALRNQIDSLNILYRRRLDQKDSLFYNSIESSKEISIDDLPEEIRNAVKYDQNTNENMRADKPVGKPSKKPSIDTTGISID